VISMRILSPIRVRPYLRVVCPMSEHPRRANNDGRQCRRAPPVKHPVRVQVVNAFQKLRGTGNSQGS